MSQTKLIRDKIPKIIQNIAEVPLVVTASDEVFEKKLSEKLQEECKEFLESGNPEELVDILEVIYAICDIKRISKEELEQIRKQKAEKRGKFTKKLLLTIHE